MARSLGESGRDESAVLALCGPADSAAFAAWNDDLAIRQCLRRLCDRLRADRRHAQCGADCDWRADSWRCSEQPWPGVCAGAGYGRDYGDLDRWLHAAPKPNRALAALTSVSSQESGVRSAMLS